MNAREIRYLPVLAVVFVSGRVLNFAWEMAQSVLYAPMGSVAAATWRCFIASVGDAVLILSILVVGWAAFERSTWFAAPRTSETIFMTAAALSIGIAVEWWGLQTGRWAYGTSMPLVRVINLGLVPLVQLPFLTPATLLVSARWLGIK